MSKIPKQLPNCLKIAETSVFQMVFNSVLCEICTYAVTVFTVVLYESGIRKALLGS